MDRLARNIASFCGFGFGSLILRALTPPDDDHDIPHARWRTSAPSRTGQGRTHRRLFLDHSAASRNNHVPIALKIRPLRRYFVHRRYTTDAMVIYKPWDLLKRTSVLVTQVNQGWEKKYCIWYMKTSRFEYLVIYTCQVKK